LKVSRRVLKGKKMFVIESRVVVNLSPFTFFSEQKWKTYKARKVTSPLHCHQNKNIIIYTIVHSVKNGVGQRVIRSMAKSV